MVIKGWRNISLGIIADFQGGSQPPLSTFSDHRLPDYVRLLQIRDYKTDKYCVYIPVVLAKRFCNADDIMIGRYGPPIFQILRGLSGAYNVALIKAIPKSVDRNFLYYTLKRNDLFNYIDALSRRTSGQTGIDLNNLREFELSIPKTVAEQTAIAEALSDADHLIASLQKLIAKKKAIKQGTMQELLTGKRRLPGFSGEWIHKSFDELFNINGGVSASRAQLSTKGYCYLHYGDIHGSLKRYVDVCSEFLHLPRLAIPLGKIPKMSLLQDGDIVFVDASEDDDGTGKHIAIRNSKNITYIAGLHTIVCNQKNDLLNNLFKEYCFCNRMIQQQIIFYAVGTKVTGINKSNIAKVVLHFPENKLEQAAIAQILSDMDAEIEWLEKKLVKYQQIKQGMMQELLTGRIRLVEPAREDMFTLVPPPADYISRSDIPKKDFDEVVTISVIAKTFYHPQYPLGRVKGQKLAYLLRRKQGADISNFKMQAAGPYDSRIRYEIEPLAEQLKYIKAIGRDESTKFQPGAKIEEAMQYAEQSGLLPDIQWLKSEFEYTGVNDLEVLATVDMAWYKLEQRGKKATLSSVKNFIQSVPKWAPKLKKEHFSDANILKAINQSRRIFSSGTE